MDNNFSAQVKEIISFSREEALRLGNDFIGTEHLLLGVIREGENTAVKILKTLMLTCTNSARKSNWQLKIRQGKILPISTVCRLRNRLRKSYV